MERIGLQNLLREFDAGEHRAVSFLAVDHNGPHCPGSYGSDIMS
jgi:hypothetical protein